jgi:hypothetical protein
MNSSENVQNRVWKLCTYVLQICSMLPVGKQIIQTCWALSRQFRAEYCGVKLIWNCRVYFSLVRGSP